MPTINVIKPFPWSPDGKEVIDYSKGVHDVPERCAVVAVDQLKVATRLSDKEKAELEKEAAVKAEAAAAAKKEANAAPNEPPAKAAKATAKK